MIPRMFIASAIDLLVFISGRGAERRVGPILEVVSPDGEDDYWAPEYPDPSLKLVSLSSSSTNNGRLKNGGCSTPDLLLKLKPKVSQTLQ